MSLNPLTQKIHFLKINFKQTFLLRYSDQIKYSGNNEMLWVGLHLFLAVVASAKQAGRPPFPQATPGLGRPFSSCEHWDPKTRT